MNLARRSTLISGFLLASILWPGNGLADLQKCDQSNWVAELSEVTRRVEEDLSLYRFLESRGELEGAFQSAKRARAVEIISGFKGKKLQKHFKKHGDTFSASTAEEYEELAYRFAAEERSTDLVIVGPRTGATFKFNTETNEFMVISSKGVLETYFKPKPEIHGFESNLEYFLRQYEKY